MTLRPWLLGLSVLALCACGTHKSAGVTTETENGLVASIAMPDGRPASSARITVRPMAWTNDGTLPNVAPESLEVAVLDSLTDGKGILRLPNLSAGSWLLEARSADGTLAAARSFQTAQGTLALQLQATSTVFGSVTHATELDSAWVRIPGLRKRARCDSAGNFLLTDVPQGFLQIQAVAAWQGLAHQRRLVAQATLEGTNLGPLDVYTPQAAPPQASHAAWSDSVQVTLQHDSTTLDTTLTGFPLLVRIHGSDIDFTKSIGHDLHFERNGHSLPYELERWDATLGVADVWVHVDSIIPGQDLTLGMWYGNPSALDSSSPSQTFPVTDGFLETWHLSNRISTNGNLLSGSYQDDNGVSGKGVAFLSGQALHSAKQVAQPASFTVSAWVRANQLPLAGDRVFALGSAGTGWEVSFTGDQRLQFRVANGIGPVSQALYSGIWHLMVGIMDSERGRASIYLDGVFAQQVQISPTVPMLSSAWIGDGFSGAVDEARIRAGSIAPAWIELEYQNQKPGSGLVQLRRY